MKTPEDNITITVSRETATAIMRAMDNRRIVASAHRNPHIVAHRAAAEIAAVTTERQYQEYLAALATALGVSE